MENSRHWVSDVASIWYAAGSCALAHALVTLKLKHVFTLANLGFISQINKCFECFCIIVHNKYNDESKRQIVAYTQIGGEKTTVTPKPMKQTPSATHILHKSNQIVMMR